MGVYLVGPSGCNEKRFVKLGGLHLVGLVGPSGCNENRFVRLGGLHLVGLVGLSGCSSPRTALPTWTHSATAGIHIHAFPLHFTFQIFAVHYIKDTVHTFNVIHITTYIHVRIYSPLI